MVIRVVPSDLLPSERFRMAVEEVQRRMERIARALHAAQDRVHLRDMISVGLVTEALADTLPADLGARLRDLFATIRQEAEEDRQV
jgi:hypothetical protein